MLQLQLGPWFPKPNLQPCLRPHVGLSYSCGKLRMFAWNLSQLWTFQPPSWDSAVLEGEDLQLTIFNLSIKTTNKTVPLRRDEMPEDNSQVQDLCTTPLRGAKGSPDTPALG